MDLPHEIWLEIFVYTHSCLFSASCRLVCRGWKQLLDSPAATTGLWRKLGLDTYKILRSLYKRGALSQLQKVVALFGISAEVIRQEDNCALYKTCINGHLEQAKWLASNFQLTAEDVRECDSDTLRKTCEHGHLLVAQWLVG